MRPPPPPTRRPAHALQSLAAASSLVTAKKPISEAAQSVIPANDPASLTPAAPSAPASVKRRYLSGRPGAARGRAHGEKPPPPCGRGRGKQFDDGALRVRLPPRGHRAGGRTQSRKGPHVPSREGRRRPSCSARCRRAGLNLSRARRRSISELARLRCIPGAGPHREHSGNIGGSGRRHPPTVHDRLESLITLRGIRTARRQAARQGSREGPRSDLERGSG